MPGSRLAHAIPWRTLRALFWSVRNALFRKPLPESPGLRVSLDADRGFSDLEIAFGQAYFTTDWEFSYSYRGEVLNMARPEYHPGVSVEGTPTPWVQTHVRAFRAADGSDDAILAPHHELEPTAYPRWHVAARYMAIDRGITRTAAVLADAGYSREYIPNVAEAATPTPRADRQGV